MSYTFYGRGIEYTYSLARGGTFNALTARWAPTGAVFHPSLFGGFVLDLADAQRSPWDPIVSHQLLQHTRFADTVIATWAMSVRNQTLKYSYRFHIAGNTLVIDMAADPASGSLAAGFDLDRAQSASEQHIIGIPYLVLFNVLLCDGLFTTFFFDWEYSNASGMYGKGSRNSINSVYFAQSVSYQRKTDGTRNAFRERLYLTVSPNLEDVFPNIPNPVSRYKNEMAKRILWFYNGLIDGCLEQLDALYRSGVRNLWLQIHEWQRAGFDKELPDVMPASFVLHCDLIGQQGAAHDFLAKVGRKAKAYGYLFGLHENYVDYYPSAPSFDKNHVALAETGQDFPAYANLCHNSREQSYLLKPSKAAYYLNRIAPEIHRAYQTTSSYLDVCTALNPSVRVDYDAAVPGAGMFRETMRYYRELAEHARRAHEGPVQGEGDFHLLYQGYYDDIEARITCGRATSPSGCGSGMPLIVDFDLLKLHEKTVVHGVGNYESFFGMPPDFPRNERYSRDHVLTYVATTLAYGHGAYLTAPGRSVDFVGDALLTQAHVFKPQMAYANARATKIRYHDNGSMVTASEFIRAHPKEYDQITDDAFMSQVRVEYDNGVVVCVNRHPRREWTVSGVGKTTGWFSARHIVNGKEVLLTGKSRRTTFLLPPNGWVCYVPS